MAQLNQEHFHVIDSNKARRHEELKKENTIFKEHLQAEMLKPKKS